MKRFLIIITCVLGWAVVVNAQSGVRVSPSPVTSASTTPGPISTVPGAKVNFCTAPANAVPCTNFATTYTDATLGTPCATNTQVVLDGTNSCMANADTRGNWGVWVASGQYAYTITLTSGQSLGPFFVTAGGSGGGGGSPGGGDTQVQINHPAGTFAGDSTFTFNSGTKTVTAQNLISTGTLVCSSLAGVLCVTTSGTYTTIQAAYNALPSTGGIIWDRRDAATITDTLNLGGTPKQLVFYAAAATYAPTGGQLVSVPGGFATPVALICPWSLPEYFTVTGKSCVIQDQTNGVAGIAIANSVSVRVEGFNFEGSTSTGAHISVIGGTTPLAAAQLKILNNGFTGKDNCFSSTGVIFQIEFTGNNCSGQNLNSFSMNNNGGASAVNVNIQKNWFRSSGATSVKVFGADGVATLVFEKNSVTTAISAGVLSLDFSGVGSAVVKENDIEPLSISGSNPTVALSGSSFKVSGNQIFGTIAGSTLTFSTFESNRILKSTSTATVAISLDATSTNNHIGSNQTNFAGLFSDVGSNNVKFDTVNDAYYIPMPLNSQNVTTGTAPAGITSAASGVFACTETGSTGITPTALTDYMRCDLASHTFKCSQNGVAEFGCFAGGGGGTVTTTGTPASGNLTKFSGATSITNGDLSGDCTTSGTLAITCTKTNGNAFVASATTDTTNASNISSGTLNAARLPATAMQTNIVNTMTTAGTVDLSASTVANAFKVPVGAGLTATANGSINFDSTGNNFHGGAGAADSVFPTTTVTPVNGNCVNWSVASGRFKLGDAGSACGSGGLSGLTAGTPQFAASTTTLGAWGRTIIVDGTTTTAISATPAATTRYLITADVTQSAAITVSNANVTIECSPGTKITRSTATDLFDVTGNNFTLRNCVVDGNTQSGVGTGPLVKIGNSVTAANDALIQGNTFQNTGQTAAFNGTILIQNGVRTKFDNNIFPTTQTDYCISVFPLNAKSVVDTVITRNMVTTFNAGAAAESCIWGQDSNGGGATMSGLRVEHNTIYGQGSNANLLQVQGTNVSQTASSPRNTSIAFNNIFYTGAVTFGVKIFTVLNSRFVGNVIDDQTFASQSLVSIGDSYNSSFEHNTLRDQGSTGPPWLSVDEQGNSTVGNQIFGVPAVTAGMSFVEQSGPLANTSITSNSVQLTSGVAGTCYSVSMSTNSFTVDGNVISSNNCDGTAAATAQKGIELKFNTASTATIFTSTTIANNIFTDVGLPINITSVAQTGAGPATLTGVLIEGNTFERATTGVTISFPNSSGGGAVTVTGIRLVGNSFNTVTTSYSCTPGTGNTVTGTYLGTVPAPISDSCTGTIFSPELAATQTWTGVNSFNTGDLVPNTVQMPEIAAPSGVASASVTYSDSTQHAAEINNNNTGFMPIDRTACVNVTPVTVSTSTTADQNLMTCTLSANLLNVVGRTLQIFARGVYSTAATSTAQMTLKVKLCTVSGCGSGTVISPMSIQTTALGSVTVANNGWNLTANVSTQTAGATAAFEAGGWIGIDLAAITAADSLFTDTNTATVGTIASTGQLFLQITGAFSAASASNSFTERQLIVRVVN